MRTHFLLTLLIVLTLCTCVPAQGTRAAAETRLDEVYTAYGLTGEGTLVVMIDRGIDYHHPAFLRADGTTRLAYVFDMINGNDGNEYGVGQVLDAAAINADLETDGPPLSNDNHGHGTATTSIIAGNGDGSNGANAFAGVAPDATIISIKLVQDGFPAGNGSPGETGFFDPTYISIALDFAADKIEELGLPSVTLLNIGSIGGPTDGSSTVGRALAEYAARYPFVCGTGDDGGANNVARGNINQTAASNFIEIPIEKNQDGGMDVGLWYAAEDRFDIRLITPDGSTLSPAVPTNSQRTTATGENVTVWHNGSEVDFFGSTAPRREFFTRFTGGTGVYTLRLTGVTVNNGDFIATMNPANFGAPNRFLDFASNEGSINDYAASPGVITPGDYVLNSQWTTTGGNTIMIQGQGNPGELWTGSSKGPTQDGRLGIDFVAPGEVLFGAYSPGSFYSRFPSSIVAGGNGLYGIQNAVSAAAPLSTGVIALMLEMDNSLTPGQILAILQETARTDAFTGTTPNNSFGHGKLDAKAALDEVNRIVNVINPAGNDFAVKLFPNPVRSVLRVRINPSVRVQKVAVLDLTGQRVLQFSPNALTAGLLLTDLPAGAYFLQLTAAEGTSVKRFIRR